MFHIKSDEFIDELGFTTRTKQVTKSCESLQKLRVRLGSCKTSLSPPRLKSFQGDTSVVLCLGFDFLCF